MAALPFALLLQAVAEETTDIDPAAAEEVAVAVEQSTLLGLLSSVGPVGFVVIAILVVMSVLSWAVAFSKRGALSAAAKVDRRMRRTFRKTDKLGDMSAIASQLGEGPLATVFHYGYREVAQQVNKHGTIANPASVDRALALAISEESSRLQRNLGLLSTTASSAPFVGLFGTVWGVLEAFRGLGQSTGATLRAVAPGIAEALLATALGLFAAIPALIFYNIFASRIRAMRTSMQEFALEFFNVAERDYGASDGPSR